jgi:hypothetical protein
MEVAFSDWVIMAGKELREWLRATAKTGENYALRQLKSLTQKS